MSAHSTKLKKLIRQRVHDIETAISDFGLNQPDDSLFSVQLEMVVAASDYLGDIMRRHPGWPVELWRSGAFQSPNPAERLRVRLGQMCDAAQGEAGLQMALRQFRHREMLRILWRDLNGLAELDDVLAELSTLASVCIDETLDRLYAQACERWGTPRSVNGEPQKLVVIGMGKLGAGELNVSSDVDLMFAYPEEGETDSERRPLDNETFFRRLGQRLIQVLSEVTEDGFVFRVDMRLRPHGEGGRLALSFAAMEEYYQREGRDWERYALIKAHPVAGDRVAGTELLDTLRPFVFRKYLDYSAFEALREMKALVNAEVSRRGLEDNIKLGHGGIREIEFIVQAFQLIHGGKDVALRERRLRVTLERLARRRQIHGAVARELDAAYVYLRRLENRLQARHDQQTHELPTEPIERARVARAMNEPDWDTLCAHLAEHRRAVSTAFEPILSGPGERPDDGPWAALWHGRIDEGQAEAELAAAGFRDAPAARQALAALARSLEGRVSARARDRIDRFIPQLLARLAAGAAPDETLKRLLRVVEAVARRSAYINLLLENPAALDKVLELSRKSAWLARILARQPVLLDELLNPAQLYEESNGEELAMRLEERLATVSGGDLEAEMEVLRQFKRSQVMRVAAQDLDGRLGAAMVGERLADIAEVTLDRSLQLARRDLVEQHGEPGPVDGRRPGLAVIAYGRLGGRELGYGSDLDLVFLHDGGEQGTTDGRRPLDNARFFIRLAQRLVHMLTTRTASGRLYTVDTRLRPSGSSGLLVISFNAYGSYQQNEAWTWEHQALVRARWVAGHVELAGEFESLRRRVLGRRRDARELAAAVREMRGRMRRELAPVMSGVFDLKQSAGGIIDIEFLVQHRVLLWAHAFPELTETTTTLGALQRLTDAGRLEGNEAAVLREAWLGYTERMNRLHLQDEPPRVPEEEVAGWAPAVRDIWKRRFGRE